jgi:hypothetical protein
MVILQFPKPLFFEKTSADTIFARRLFMIVLAFENQWQQKKSESRFLKSAESATLIFTN